MAPLFERLRPAAWSDVVGQDKAVARCRGLLRVGLGGRAVWIVGKSGTGKTTIAKLLAAEIADPLCVEEIDAGELTDARVRDIERESQYRGLGADGKTGRVYIVNESHGLKRATVRQLLVTLERIPSHVLWVFTTTNDGQASLFEGTEDAHPLLSRCLTIALAQQGIAEPFAAHLERIDPAGPRPATYYRRLIQDCQNNRRDAIGRREAAALETMGECDGNAPETVAVRVG